MSASERRRCTGISLCLVVFAIRVIGQIEALLLAPFWLPPFRAWESGLVPYSLLLPVQIFLIAWMSVITVDQWRGSGLFWVTQNTTRRRLQITATLYFVVMLMRLLITAMMPPHTLLERGLMPILAHWDLAAFLILVSLAPERGFNSCARSAQYWSYPEHGRR